MCYKQRELANCADNASARIVSLGEKIAKTELQIPDVLFLRHQTCSYHIHDLEYFDITYNCIGVKPSDLIPQGTDSNRALFAIVDGIVNLTNQQSGGIGLIDFDNDFAAYVEDQTDAELERDFSNFLYLLNAPLRKGCEKAYVTINFGLSVTPKGRQIIRCLLNAYRKNLFIFPNLVFQVSEHVNRLPESPNYDLYQLSCAVTAECMNPTYLNMDASFNRDLKPECFGIMGCRTRVDANLFQERGALHRGNIAAVTINLVQLAMESIIQQKPFYSLLEVCMDDAQQLLLYRFNCLLEKGLYTHLRDRGIYQGSTMEHDQDMLKNGTLSIGWIGLWDALMILHKQESLSAEQLFAWRDEGLEIIRHMREKTDLYTQQAQLNFSLLASSGEGVSGRFPAYDQAHYPQFSAAFEKGFYTNSFHAPVDVDLSCFQKIEFEAPFHALCNGGHITYVELKESPRGNAAAIQDLVDIAVTQEIGYFGINYPLDYCRNCNSKGTFDISCPICGSQNIHRLRRVSGYLSDQATFTTGKWKELQKRAEHQGKLRF